MGEDMMKALGFVSHDDYLKHDTGEIVYDFKDSQMSVGMEFENPERVNVIKEALAKSGLLGKMQPFQAEQATTKDLRRVHTNEHIKNMQRIAKEGTGKRIFGEEVYGSEVSEEIARLSAGGALKAVDVVMDKQTELEQAYALIRPPGHHATREKAMGFCLYNNVAIAARYAQEKYGLRRVAIVDWDVHHGNGTQDIFYEDDSVLFISVHEDGYFPLDEGSIGEVGNDEGAGYNVNIPLPSGTEDEGYIRAFEEIVVPLLREFEPELLLVSAGQDPNALDPLSRMLVMRPGFQKMAAMMRETAEELCDGRLVAIQEGGYSLPYLPIATLGVVEGLMNYESDFVDPHVVPRRDMHEDVNRVIEECKEVHQAYWNSLQAPVK